MADKKISELTSLAEAGIDAANDVLAIVDATGPETKKSTVSAIVGAGASAGITELNVDGDVDLRAATTETRALQIGTGRSGNGYAFLDLVGDATYTDYGTRLTRQNSGANANTELLHRGTGSLLLNAIEAGPIVFNTTNTERMRIDSSGKITDQYGNIRAIPQSGSDKTGSYTLATTDVGRFIGVGSGGSITVPDATFAAGDVVSIFNNTTGDVTLTMSITTAYIGGTDADVATITLATRGVATILFISGTVCVVNGNVS